MDIKLVIVLVALATLLLILLRLKNSIALPALIAFFISATWTWVYRYEYIGENIFLFDRINIYPLVVWTCGLTMLYIIQRHWIGRRSITIAILCYIVLLFALEAVGYHVLNIRLTSNFPSIFNSGIIHGPISLKLFYTVAGPAYLIFLSYLHKSGDDKKNPRPRN